MLALKIYVAKDAIAIESSIEPQIKAFLLMQHALAVMPQDYYGTHVPTDIGRCVVMPIPVI